MGYNFMPALLGLLLLACSSIHAAYSNTQEGNIIHTEKTLPLEYPAASRVDELLSQSSGDHNELVSRKLLRGAVKTQSEHSRSDDSDQHVVERDLESKITANDDDDDELLLSGASLNHISTQNERKRRMTANEPRTPASSMRTPISAIQIASIGSGEHQSKLQITGKEGRVTSLKSLLTNLYNNLHRRIQLLEVSKKQIISDTMAKITVVDSNKHIPATPVSLQVSQPFSDPYATSESPIPDNTTDITGMDYTPAQKKPPIHNKLAP